MGPKKSTSCSARDWHTISYSWWTIKYDSVFASLFSVYLYIFFVLLTFNCPLLSGKPWDSSLLHLLSLHSSWFLWYWFQQSLRRNIKLGSIGIIVQTNPHYQFSRVIPAASSFRITGMHIRMVSYMAWAGSTVSLLSLYLEESRSIIRRELWVPFTDEIFSMKHMANDPCLPDQAATVILGVTVRRIPFICQGKWMWSRPCWL